MALPQSHRSLLLRIARESIAAMLEGTRPSFPVDGFDEALTRPSGAFVTLNTRSGALRGCIGSIELVAPLWQAVSTSAINAAFRDPRFHPVASARELAGLVVEISVMGAIVRVTDPAEIVVGRDGLIIEFGRNRGLLLPQVASEYGWDRETFLDQTCVKAGLAEGTWRDPSCRIERFPAEVFGEEDAENKDLTRHSERSAQ